MARILVSPGFRRARRLGEFLNYIVECKFISRPTGHRGGNRPSRIRQARDVQHGRRRIVRTEAILRQRLNITFPALAATRRLFWKCRKAPMFRCSARAKFRRRPRRRVTSGVLSS